MAKTIILTDLIVDNLNIDYENQRVFASYRMVDDNGATYEQGEAIFWVTMPDLGEDQNGDPIPPPPNWFILPPSYIPGLLSLQEDADTALTAAFLV